MPQAPGGAADGKTMRVLLSTIGSRGGVQPLVALGSCARPRPSCGPGAFAAQLTAAAAGIGLLLAPEPYLPRFGLVAVRPGRALASAWASLPLSELWLVGHVALRRVPRVAVLWDFLLAELTRPW
jgi:DNA-binding transcriptional LysR family regulator